MNSLRRESSQGKGLLLLFLQSFRFLPFVFGEFLFAPLIVSLNGEHACISSAVPAGITSRMSRPAGGLEPFLTHLAKRSTDGFGLHQNIADAFEQIVEGKGLEDIGQVFLFEERGSLGCGSFRDNEKDTYLRLGILVFAPP